MLRIYLTNLLALVNAQPCLRTRVATCFRKGKQTQSNLGLILSVSTAFSTVLDSSRVVELVKISPIQKGGLFGELQAKLALAGHTTLPFGRPD